jgi:hypothetical protein
MLLGFANFISPQGIKELKNYKYVGGAYTPGDMAMQPFWNWFVTLVPMVSLDFCETSSDLSTF